MSTFCCRLEMNRNLRNMFFFHIVVANVVFLAFKDKYKKVKRLSHFWSKIGGAMATKRWPTYLFFFLSLFPCERESLLHQEVSLFSLSSHSRLFSTDFPFKRNTAQTRNTRPPSDCSFFTNAHQYKWLEFILPSLHLFSLRQYLRHMVA